MDKIITNFSFKLFLFFIIINIILEENSQKKETNKLENYYSKSICKLFHFSINYNCPITIFSSSSFYDEVLEINKDINLLINAKKSKLENLLFLLSIIPFLKYNSTLIIEFFECKINFIIFGVTIFLEQKLSGGLPTNLSQVLLGIISRIVYAG